MKETLIFIIKFYFNHLWNYYIDYNYFITIFHDEWILWILKNILHKYDIKSIQIHLKIMKSILHAMFSIFNSIHDDINLYIIFCMTFTTFLYIKEFIWIQWNINSSLQFFFHDLIQFVTNDILLQLSAFKTDFFHKNITIPLSFSCDFIYSIITLYLLFHYYSKSFNESLFSHLYDLFTHDWIL